MNYKKLPPLTNIIDTFVYIKHNDYKICDMDDMNESLEIYLNDYLEHNIKIYKQYDFHEIIEDYLYDIIVSNEKYFDLLESFDEDIYDFIDEFLFMYFLKNKNNRSYDESILLTKQTREIKQKIHQRLESIALKKQPEQKTEEWYKFRWMLLTASNLWKALDTAGYKNNLIYEKCKPINTDKYNSVNINTPFHHGHKYEPLSIMLYEELFDTEIGEYGCIQHDTELFLGASPDGINIKQGNERYGRMLEIKNPVSRELTGIPKKDYWVQMQLQMEVWDLDECDFYETVFKEYKNEEEFLNDGDFYHTENGKRKGLMVQFYDKEPIYKYAPLDLKKNDVNKWIEFIIDENPKLTWVQNIYWYLKDYSLVTVPRIKSWFKAIVNELREVWKTILHERKNGYEHRKPQKRTKIKKNNINVIKNTNSWLYDLSDDEDDIDTKNACKSDKKNENENENINEKTSKIIDAKYSVSPLVIKIRTESFEESQQNIQKSKENGEKNV